MAKKKSAFNKEPVDDIPLESLDAMGSGDSMDSMEPENPVKAKVSAALARFFELFKFLLGLGLLPFVYGFTLSFLNEIVTIGPVGQSYFWSGVSTFVLVYLFVWEPAVVYAKGQKVLEVVFNLFKPLVKVAPFVLPVYSLLLFVAYWIASFFASGTLKYFLFFFGFFLVLHLVFGAKTLRSRKGGFLKGHYIFSFSFVYILSIIITALCFNAIFERYSFVLFFNQSFHIGRDVFVAIFRQLFVVK